MLEKLRDFVKRKNSTPEEYKKYLDDSFINEAEKGDWPKAQERLALGANPLATKMAGLNFAYDGLHGACTGRHKDFVKELLNHLQEHNPPIDYRESLKEALVITSRADISVWLRSNAQGADYELVGILLDDPNIGKIDKKTLSGSIALILSSLTWILSDEISSKDENNREKATISKLFDVGADPQYLSVYLEGISDTVRYRSPESNIALTEMFVSKGNIRKCDKESDITPLDKLAEHFNSTHGFSINGVKQDDIFVKMAAVLIKAGGSFKGQLPPVFQEVMLKEVKNDNDTFQKLTGNIARLEQPQPIDNDEQKNVREHSYITVNDVVNVLLKRLHDLEQKKVRKPSDEEDIQLDSVCEPSATDMQVSSIRQCITSVLIDRHI